MTLEKNPKTRVKRKLRSENEGPFLVGSFLALSLGWMKRDGTSERANEGERASIDPRFPSHLISNEINDALIIGGGAAPGGKAGRGGGGGGGEQTSRCKVNQSRFLTKRVECPAYDRIHFSRSSAERM